MIRDEFGTTNTFNNGRNDRPCYNGLPIDSYPLILNMNKFKTLPKRKNLFSYTNLQFSHDSYGLNTQTMDKVLGNYFKHAATLNNTLTIVLSDHGNSYTSYSANELEGRYEMYHPALFMIVPDRVRSILGEKKLRAMRKNQKRLMTMVDIHNGIRHLVDESSAKKGFLQIINPQITCKHLNLSMPNMCVCEGSETPLLNDTDLIGQLEFSFGQLNKMIHNESRTGQCKNLVPTSVENAFVIPKGNGVLTKFDVTTASGGAGGNERFGMEVYHEATESMEHFNAKLTNSFRLSKYSTYKRCSDASQFFRYCVCNRDKFSSESFRELLSMRTSPKPIISFPNVTVMETIRVLVNDTLALLIREYKTNDETTYRKSKKKIKQTTILAVTFEAMAMGNSAEQKNFRVEVKIEQKFNLKFMGTDSKCVANIKQRGIAYMCTLARGHKFVSMYSYNVDYKRLP
jgi:Protein of unknown function (DUF229).